MTYAYTHGSDKDFREHVIALTDAGYRVERVRDGVVILTATDHSTGVVYRIVIVRE